MVREYAGLAADEYGRQDGRPSLVLLHGLSFDRRMWDPVLEELAAVDRGRHVLAFDLPGHGQSADAGCYRFESVAAIVARAIGEAGLNKPVIVGHSIAAVIASLYAARNPTRGVVNVDQSLRVERFARFAHAQAGRIAGPEFCDVWRMFWASMSTHLLPGPAQELLRTTSRPRQEVVAGYWRDLLELSPAELAAWSSSRLRRLREEGTPYLVVAGGELDSGYRSWLEGRLPRATVTVLSRGGHFPHLVHPRRFAECLAWMERGSPRAPSVASNGQLRANSSAAFVSNS